ncbi:hypothetical protein DFR74_113109, partial [Nocardia puris]
LSEGVEEVASVLALAARPRQSEYFSLGREG